MAVDVYMPEKKENTSMFRRLVGIAAPIVGGIYGGPAGAAAGSAIGTKIAGGSNEDATVNAAQSAAQPQDNAMSRRLKEKPPEKSIQEGLDALTLLPPELQNQYGPYLQKAQMRVRTV